MLSSFFDQILLSYGEYSFTVGRLLLWILGIIALIILYHTVVRKWLTTYVSRVPDTTIDDLPRLRKKFNWTFVSVFLLLTLVCSGFDLDLTPKSNINFKISYFLIAICLFQAARILDWFTSKVFIHNAFLDSNRVASREKPTLAQSEKKVSRLGRMAVYAIAINLLVQLLNLDFTIFSRRLSDGLVFNFKISNILIVFLIVVGTRLFLWFLGNVVMRNIYLRNGLDQGASFAVNQLIRYVIWTLAIFFCLDALGIDVTLLLGGAAALLVGIGLGLQSTFNDFIAGIVLLFERSVQVGDMLDTHGVTGRVKRIGLRSSIIETRGQLSVIVPNGKLVNQDVTNWSHSSDKTRFEVSVGVAYGTDTSLVKSILLKIAKENPYVIEYPPPFVRFNAFGESSLDFTLYFFSRNYMVIEDIKSDIRFDIDKEFRTAAVEIPFPQRVIRMVKE